MTYKKSRTKIESYRKKIAALRDQMRETQAAIEPEEVTDYAFKTAKGEVALSKLFGDNDTLIMIHNMGASCPYCTLWADGFNGVHKHLADRAAFVVSSPDKPANQEKFKASRGWGFPLVSHDGSTFAADMGYRNEQMCLPGISVFKKKRNKIMRVSDTQMGPGDDFCSVWHFFDMIPEGPAGWQPKYKY